MLWQDENSRKGRGRGGDVKIWFCGLFSNIGSTPRPIPWHHLCPRECFPCQHTSVSVAELSVSCGFWSGHPDSGTVLLQPVPGRKPSFVVKQPVTSAGVLGFRQATIRAL